MRVPAICLLIFFVFFVHGGWASPADGDEVVELQAAQVDPAALAVIFSGVERMHYAVSWSGGVKIGDIYLDIQKDEKGGEGAFAITAKVKDYGPLKVFYPVDDRFVCFVSGPMKLPDRYEVLQKEGFGKKTTRLIRYDQDQRVVWYKKNKEDELRFEVAGTLYNEFSAFVISRALAFRLGESIVVPTFAEQKRHEVEVALVKRTNRKSIFGNKPVMMIQPRMQFQGLYEKSGNTTLWLTDDRCRVPVEIHSKITIGALVAELVEYANPACPELVKAASR